MTTRSDIKIGEKLIMSVPDCTPKKCVCKKNVKKIVRNAEEGYRMQAVFSYAEGKRCPVTVQLDTRLLGRAVVVGEQTIARQMGRVVARLAALATTMAVIYLVGSEVVKWLS